MSQSNYKLLNSLNRGIEWYSQNLRSVPSDLQNDIDKLLSATNPLTFKEIKKLCELNPTECPRYALNQLKKSEILNLLDSPTNATKSQLIEVLLKTKGLHEKTKRPARTAMTKTNKKMLQIGGTDKKQTQTKYDDLGAKTLALLKLDKYTKIFHLNLNKKLPLTTQKAIKRCLGQLKPIYQTGGALSLPPVADPMIIATAIGGVLLLTIIAIGMMFRNKSIYTRLPPNAGDDAYESDQDPELDLAKFGSTIDMFLNRAIAGDPKALLTLSKLALTNNQIRTLIMNNPNYPTAQQIVYDKFMKRYLDLRNMQDLPFEKALEKAFLSKTLNETVAKQSGRPQRLADGSLMLPDGSIEDGSIE